jgi:GNAT superfamily N-acetyltransferase
MPSKPPTPRNLEIRPLTAGRWPDLERLFGERGACGGCWCMWWRMKRSEFEKRKGEGNKKLFKKIATSGETPGLLAYNGRQPVAWCAIAPREAYPVLENSRVLKRIDDQPVWSVVCFFVARPYRRRGVTARLLKAAVDYARRRGARIIEGYPVESRKARMPDAFAWTGLVATFRKVGFVEAARRSKTRPIMRLAVKAR